MQQRFDGFLDYVCGDIISDRERENARNELYDHLMCTYECNLAQGMDEEHAAIEAENSMGDKNDVKANSVRFTRASRSSDSRVRWRLLSPDSSLHRSK